MCQRYGVSRQTFYNLQERFLSEGTAGLLAKKPGPKGPSKLTAEVRQFVEQQIQHDPHLSATSLRSQLEEQFSMSFHKRTIEKLLKDLRSKKTPKLPPSKECRRGALNDIATMRYEALRRAFLLSEWQGMDEDWARFFSLGFVGLLPFEPVAEYVVEVYAAPVRRWWGRLDPKEQALLEVFRLLTAHPPLGPMHPGDPFNERRVICSCLDQESRAAGDHRFSDRSASLLREDARL